MTWRLTTRGRRGYEGSDDVSGVRPSSPSAGKVIDPRAGNPRSAATDGRSPGCELRPQAAYIRAWDLGNPSLIGPGTVPPLPGLSEGPRWIWAPRAFDSAPRISAQPDADQARHHHPAITSAARNDRYERALVGESAVRATATVSFGAGSPYFEAGHGDDSLAKRVGARPGLRLSKRPKRRAEDAARAEVSSASGYRQ